MVVLLVLEEQSGGLKRSRGETHAVLLLLLLCVCVFYVWMCIVVRNKSAGG